MRRPLTLFALALLACWPVRVRAAVSFVQFANTSGDTDGCYQSGTTCPTNAFSSNVTAGHMIAVCGGWSLTSGTGNALSSVSDTRGNTFSVVAATKITLASTNYTELGAECAYTTSISGGADTVTCSFSVGNVYKGCYAWELSGNATSPVDKTSTGTGTTSTTISAGTVTLSSAGEVGIVAMEVDDGNGSATFTAGSGWTIDGQTSGGNGGLAGEHQAVASAGNLTGSLTTNKTPNHWVATMITFAPPATAVPGPRPPVGPF